MGTLLGQFASTFFAALADVVLLFTMICVTVHVEDAPRGISERRRATAFFVSSGLCGLSAISNFVIVFLQQDLWTFFKVILVLGGIIKFITFLALLCYSSRITPNRDNSPKQIKPPKAEPTTPVAKTQSKETLTIPALEKPVQSEPEDYIVQTVIKNFATLGWNRWSSSIHSYSDQYKRILRGRDPQSLMYIVEYNSANGHAIINGTSGKNYLVSGNGCSCRDFHDRCLPCKHMYFLSFKIVRPNFQTTLGNGDYFRGLSFAIAGSSQEKIKDYIKQHKGKIVERIDKDTTALIVNTSKATQKVIDAQLEHVEIMTFDDLKALF